MTEQSAIPTVDLRHFTGSPHGSEAKTDPEIRTRLIDTLGSGFKEFGFLIVEGHGIDPGLIRQAYELGHQLFRLPEEKRRAYAGVEGSARGYTPFGIEHAKDQGEPDLKEFWQVGRELPEGHPFRAEYKSNVWPEEIPEWRDVATRLFDALEECAVTLLHALAEYLGVPRDRFTEMIVDGNHVLRVIHYPPVASDAAPNAMRSAPHEDINMITLLCEATDSGLEILTGDGEWLAVEAGPGQIVADAGDMLARVVNDFIPATTHRVVNTPESVHRSRFSMPFFVHPYSACDLTVMKEFTTPEASTKYPPVTAGEFLEERLREIGLKDG